MRRRTALIIALVFAFPPALPAQTQATRPAPDGVMASFVRIADAYGARLVAAFDSIPAARYDYRPMPTQ